MTRAFAVGTLAFPIAFLVSPFATIAQHPPTQSPFNKGQCQQIFEDRGLIKEEAHFTCKEGFTLNQGRCFKLAKERPEFITKEECRFQF